MLLVSARSTTGTQEFLGGRYALARDAAMTTWSGGVVGRNGVRVEFPPSIAACWRKAQSLPPLKRGEKLVSGGACHHRVSFCADRMTEG